MEATKGGLSLLPRRRGSSSGEFECSRHVLARHIAGREDELADCVLFESVFFEKVVADAFVRGWQTPAF